MTAPAIERQGPASGPLVLVFDVDDTLYLERDFVRSGFAAVDRHLERTQKVDGFLDVAWGLFEGGRRGDIFDAALPEVGCAATKELVHALLDVYREHHPDIALLDDAERILSWAAARGPLAALTDGYAVTQLRKVEALGLDRYCQPIIRTGVWGREYWKPHQRGFESIQGFFGLSGEAFIYIADNPVKDFIAPKALGWKTIRIRRPGGLHVAVDMNPGEPVDRTIESFDDLKLEGDAACLLTC